MLHLHGKVIQKKWYLSKYANNQDSQLLYGQRILLERKLMFKTTIKKKIMEVVIEKLQNTKK